MKLLDTEHKRKSMTITVIVHVIILILLFYVGMKYLDPPLEQGIAINFGTTVTGSGKIQPTEKIQSAPQKTTPEPVSQPKAEIKEEVVTQDNEDAPVIKKEKPKMEQKETSPKEQPKKEVKKPDPKPDKSTTDALSSILNGPKSDGTAKGGVVIGISDQFKIPVKYIGVGEGMEDLQVFNKYEFVDSLFKD